MLWHSLACSHVAKSSFRAIAFHHKPPLSTNGATNLQPMKLTESTPLCITCKNNDNGICKLTNRDMYENRMIPVKYGGCGEAGTKHQPKYVVKEDSGEFRIPYSWS
jgi:hypothetical protein